VTDTDFKHRLAAILAADAAGYSRLMAGNDRSTVASLDAARAVFRSRIEAHGGRVVDMAGDSVLAAFDTASGAVTAALAAQVELAALGADVSEERRMKFRIGVHLGDVIEKADGTVYGDGVNIAARLEGLAEPGGITISDAVRGAVRGKVAASFDDQGEQRVKNIPDPVRAFAVRAEASVPSVPAEPTPPVAAIDLSLPDRPSIAVLPFTNMSGDAEQEYFTDGITEDIITELSRFHSLFVIARNSSFSYKGKSTDVRQVGKELGVRYVLEGSIRKSASRIRVTGQLIDALSGSHIWAEKYDRVLEDIFALQEELTRSIVAAIAPHIDDAEHDKVRRRRPGNLGAYEGAVSAWAKAWAALVHSDARLFDEALGQADAALAVDAGSAQALQVIAFVHVQRVTLGLAADRAAAWQAGMAAATRAIELDRHDSLSWGMKAWLLSMAPDARLTAEGLPTAQRAHELNPNNLPVLAVLAFCEVSEGLPELAIVHLQQALRLNPRDPRRHSFFQLLALACALTGDHADGVAHALLGLADAPDVPQLHGLLAMNHVGLGDVGKAREAFETARRLGPAWVERCLAGGFALRKPENLRRATTLLRVAAGLEDAVER